MTDNVTPINIARKIKSLKKSIATLTKLSVLKQNYLNNLSLFTEYSNINQECHSLKAEIRTILSTIDKHQFNLSSLRKDI